MSELLRLDLLLHGWIGLVDLVVLGALVRFRGRALAACLGGALVALVGAVVVARLAGSGGSFAVMRGACWVLYVHGPLVLLAGAVLGWRATRADALLLGLFALLTAAVGVDGFVVEPRWLEVTHAEAPAPGLAERLRIAVLTDTQSDDWGSYEEGVFRRAMAERPDLIVMPGDFVQVDVDLDRYPAQVAAMRALLPILEAPLGVYAVEGNIEWRDTWAEDLFAGTSVHAVRRTTTFDLGPLALTAIGFRDGFDPHLAVADPGKFHVAFAHGPDYSLSAEVRADLLIAGHTHGGQVRLPFFGPPITYSRVPRAWAAGGLHDVGGGRRLLLARGVGMERGYAPRLRVNCRPELAFVDLVPAG